MEKKEVKDKEQDTNFEILGHINTLETVNNFLFMLDLSI